MNNLSENMFVTCCSNKFDEDQFWESVYKHIVPDNYNGDDKEQIIIGLQTFFDVYQKKKKIRPHKHRYSGRFGNVAVQPFESLIHEILKNPTTFTEEEKNVILQAYKEALLLKGAYDVLGFNVIEQMNKIKDEGIPKLRSNAQLLSRLLSSGKQFVLPGTVPQMHFAHTKTKKLCEDLTSIEKDDKYEPKPVNIINCVESAFKEDLDELSRKGIIPYRLDINGRDSFSNTGTFIDPDGFKELVLHNLIENFHKYAFNEFNQQLEYLAPQIGNTTKWYRRIWNWLFGKKESKTNLYLEKKIQIRFYEDSADPNRFNIDIKNNGKKFEGDPNKVFDDGVGEGTGIGLFAASDFLKKYNATIRMISNPCEEFTVTFTINMKKLIPEENV